MMALMDMHVSLTESQHRHVLAQAKRLGRSPEMYISQLIERDQDNMPANAELLPIYLDACLKQFAERGPSKRSLDDIWQSVKTQLSSATTDF